MTQQMNSHWGSFTLRVSETDSSTTVKTVPFSWILFMILCSDSSTCHFRSRPCMLCGYYEFSIHIVIDTRNREGGVFYLSVNEFFFFFWLLEHFTCSIISWFHIITVYASLILPVFLSWPIQIPRIYKNSIESVAGTRLASIPPNRSV